LGLEGSAIGGIDAERDERRRAIVAMNRCDRSFARSHDRPHANSLRASWRRNDQSDLR
jgi:hypothetical protein